MWAVPTFLLATWWSKRLLAAWPVSSPRTFRVLWAVGSVSAFAVLTVATTNQTDGSWFSPVWLAWGAVIGVVGSLLAIDVAARRLPRQLSLPAFGVSLVVLSLVEGPAGRGGPILGALAMIGVAVVLRVLTRGSLGLGDVLLSPLLGVVLGWFDPAAVVVAWALTAGFGGVGALVSLLRGKRPDSVIAYGPALLVGTAAALLGVAW